MEYNVFNKLYGKKSLSNTPNPTGYITPGFTSNNVVEEPTLFDHMFGLGPTNDIYNFSGRQSIRTLPIPLYNDKQMSSPTDKSLFEELFDYDFTRQNRSNSDRREFVSTPSRGIIKKESRQDENMARSFPTTPRQNNFLTSDGSRSRPAITFKEDTFLDESFTTSVNSEVIDKILNSDRSESLRTEEIKKHEKNHELKKTEVPKLELKNEEEAPKVRVKTPMPQKLDTMSRINFDRKSPINENIEETPRVYKSVSIMTEKDVDQTLSATNVKILEQNLQKIIETTFLKQQSFYDEQRRPLSSKATMTGENFQDEIESKLDEKIENEQPKDEKVETKSSKDDPNEKKRKLKKRLLISAVVIGFLLLGLVIAGLISGIVVSFNRTSNSSVTNVYYYYTAANKVQLAGVKNLLYINSTNTTRHY